MDTLLLALFSEKWRARISVRAIYFSAMACAVLLGFVYLASLSVGISYDGHVYIDLADMLGTARSVKDWSPYRTPLFPLALKISFWLFGKQALALVMVMSAAGVAGILVLGIIVKEMAGYIAGAVMMIALSLYPTLVGYERMVLTETGIFLFIAVMVLLSMRIPQDGRGAWVKTASLISVCTLSYYWRQNLLSLAYWLAFLHLLAWRSSPQGKAALRGRSPRLAVTLAQCVLIAVLPNVAVRLWGRTPTMANSSMSCWDMALLNRYWRTPRIRLSDRMSRPTRARYKVPCSTGTCIPGFAPIWPIGLPNDSSPDIPDPLAIYSFA